MLSNDEAVKWLAVDDQIAHALTLLKPFPADAMEGYDVSQLVNNPRNDLPECILRAEGKPHDGTLQRRLRAPSVRFIRGQWISVMQRGALDSKSSSYFSSGLIKKYGLKKS